MTKPIQTKTWDGLSIIFTRDEWQTVLDCLDYTYENYFTYENTVGAEGQKIVDIALKIKNYMVDERLIQEKIWSVQND